MKKQYEPPTIEIEEFELEDMLCNILSGNMMPNSIMGDEYDPIL